MGNAGPRQVLNIGSDLEPGPNGARRSRRCREQDKELNDFKYALRTRRPRADAHLIKNAADSMIGPNNGQSLKPLTVRHRWGSQSLKPFAISDRGEPSRTTPLCSAWAGW
jgi:hypothetical protein